MRCRCARLARRARVGTTREIEAATVELRSKLHALCRRVDPGRRSESGGLHLGPARPARSGSMAKASRACPGDERPMGTSWGMTIGRTILRALGYHGASFVASSRFATYAIARATRHGVTVCAAMPTSVRPRVRLPPRTPSRSQAA